ncbi:MAG TPA: glycosyltransferase family protein [Candidatus Kapabacteria bacterium]|nr:glycosyltransferase family protein [Candidatus Kapabacteria bacterium]
MTRLVVVVQARMSSTRLPGKVMMPLAGRPLLERMLERVRAATLPAEIVVATTTMQEDEPLRELCGTIGVRCYSGHPTDLLDRHYRAALECEADAVVKIPSDCPLIDPAIIDRVLAHYLRHEPSYDYVSNLHPASYPDGNDVEAIAMPALETAWREAERDFEREHTTPFLWERPERFLIGNVRWERGQDYSMSHRWTIDYREDYELIAAVYDALYTASGRIFGIDAILSWLDQHPDVAALNAHLAGVNWYRHHMSELQTVTAQMTRALNNAR